MLKSCHRRCCCFEVDSIGVAVLPFQMVANWHRVRQACACYQPSL